VPVEQVKKQNVLKITEDIKKQASLAYKLYKEHYDRPQDNPSELNTFTQSIKAVKNELNIILKNPNEKVQKAAENAIQFIDNYENFCSLKRQFKKEDDPKEKEDLIKDLEPLLSKLSAASNPIVDNILLLREIASVKEEIKEFRRIESQKAMSELDDILGDLTRSKEPSQRSERRVSVMFDKGPESLHQEDSMKPSIVEEPADAAKHKHPGSKGN
jgi:hypothetical protein